MGTLILKGNIIHTPQKDKFECHENAYLISKDNSIVGIFDSLPEEYKNEYVYDYGNKLIIPGLSDLHVHASQYVYCGLGIDLQLMDWLGTYAFPTECKYSDLDYAKVYYEAFAESLAKNGTTRAVVFATKHVEGTELLMDILEKHKIAAYVGKVNMDMFCPDYICEDTKQSIADTERWLKDTIGKYKMVQPAITPRFIPTCSSEVLKAMGELAKKYDLHIHTHSTEDIGEIEISLGRYKDFPSDGHVYDSFNLLTDKTVLAHFIFPTKEEMELIRDRGVTIAHCPQSNGNVRAGVPPIRQLMNMGVKVGLGSDIAGGYSVSIFRAMADAEYLSKIRWMETGKEDTYLSVPEAFFLGTKGGGSYFGKVGSFEEGYEMDAVIIDDSNLGTHLDNFSLEQRIERVIHMADDRNVVGRFVMGEKA
ncbi:MAG: amidohydrolase family protein [Erysipelotrichaceae bacterium]|nr:amidohydrolase family protein [Erysipelotrichaceae bacterium]